MAAICVQQEKKPLAVHPTRLDIGMLDSVENKTELGWL
jgi:hypothetical protein